MREMLAAASEAARNNELGDADHRLFVHDLNESNLSPDDINAEMMLTAVGGFHTTGLSKSMTGLRVKTSAGVLSVHAVLTWGVYFLAEHQDVQAKVVEELQEVLGDEEITFESVKQLSLVPSVCMQFIYLLLSVICSFWSGTCVKFWTKLFDARRLLLSLREFKASRVSSEATRSLRM